MANKNKTSIFNGETELVKVLSQSGEAIFSIKNEAGKAVGKIHFHFKDWLQDTPKMGNEGRIKNPSASQLPRRWILNQKTPEGR